MSQVQSEQAGYDLESQQFQNSENRLREHRKKIKHVDFKQCNLGIGAFTVLMPFCGAVLNYGWFQETLIVDPFDYYLNFIAFGFFYTMAMLSYYKVIFTNNAPPKRPAPFKTMLYSYVDDIYQNSADCKKCNTWKPYRVHHCSQCNACTMKMDHHCPWGLNCIGIKNHQAFYLFCIYMFLAAAIYVYRAISYLMLQFSTGQFWDGHSFPFYILFFFTTIIISPVMVGLMFLVIFHSCVAFSNVTTLENMAGVNMMCQIGGGFMASKINIFDRGFFANCFSFLNYSQLFFWFPQEITPDSNQDGISYPMSQIINHQVYKETVLRQPKAKESEVEDYELLIQQSFNMFGKSCLQIDGKIQDCLDLNDHNVVSALLLNERQQKQDKQQVIAFNNEQ